MRTSIPFVAAIPWSARALLMGKWRSARPWRSCLVLASFACATTLSVSSFAQANGPLNFGQNYFVRGDYVVAGAQGLNTSFGADGFGTGTINIPDANPGITGAKSVPAGAEVIAAVLYWQTVEKVDIEPGQPGSGQNGFFRPVFQGGPAKGYPIVGVPLPSESTVGWSSGGCTGTSTGKLVRTYRANVVSALPRDASGNVSANGTYEVRLPNLGNNTPLTLGATLVLIYREFDPAVPLNSIVFYDGAFNPGGALLTMTQTMQGFYDAANSPVSRITHIVAGGKINKFETVKLNGVTLPSLYGNAEPPFIGYYGTWDNPTWTFPSAGILANFKNPVNAGDASAETQVVPSNNNGGCVSWSAAIISTTVQNTDGDGLLDVWKLPKAPNNSARPGYCDAAANQGVCTQGGYNWVDLPGAILGTPQKPHPDVYVQFDYMCSSPNPDGNTCKTGDGTNYSFNPTLQQGADGFNPVQEVANVYASHGITLHANQPGNQVNAHAIPEPFCQDAVVLGQQQLCVFPNPPGTTVNKGVAPWPGGVSDLERQLIDTDAPTDLRDCALLQLIQNQLGYLPPLLEGPCVPRFQPAAAASKHYGLFAHAVGQPKWSIYNGTLVSVKQAGKTVTFTTSTPVGALNVLGKDANTGKTVDDPTCAYGRVTVAGAVTNQNLDGTFCVNSFNTLGDTFTITLGSSANASYTAGTDPSLAVVPPYTSTQSGIADVGGHHFVVSLGLWGNPALSTSDGQTAAVIASTLMHEQGHAIFTLAHGGPAAKALSSPLLYQSPLYQSVTTNCKVNYLSVMSYSRQLDLLDYSESALPAIDKATLFGNLTDNDITHWYVPFPAAYANGKAVGNPATLLCTGAPIPAGETPMTEVTGPASTFSFASLSGANIDINFDGNPSENFLGACDWCVGSYDLAQTDATGSYLSSSGPPFGGGGPPFGGGGPPFGGGGPPFGGGGPPFGGGGPPFGGGGPPFGGGGEIDLGTAQSVTPAPQGLAASEGASARTITLSWTKPFGDLGAYNIYRSPGGGNGFTLIASVNGNPPATNYTDTVACNTPNGYQYFVTAVQSASSTNPNAESTPSNIVTIGQNSGALTGCYVVTGFSSPASGVQGSQVAITWVLADDFNPTANPVTKLAANTLVAIGPLPGNCNTPTLGRTTLLANGVPTYAGDGFNNNGDQFTFTWNSTDSFCAGSYTFELDLDHVPAPSGPPAQVQTTTSPLRLGIDVNDTDSTPHITPLSLPNGFVGLAYTDTLSEDGGTAPFTWNFSGSLPLGISQQSQYSPTLSGTTCAAGLYNFTAAVTDSKSNSGMQGLTLQISKANTTTGVMSSANPSVFQQRVTFTVTVAPQYTCTPTGTVTLWDGAVPIASSLPLTGGIATFTTSALSVGMHNITASYSGDGNFNSSSSTAVLQTVNMAMTAITSVSPSPAVVGQPVTVAYNFAVVSPGAGTPIGPSGTITVTASDGSSCVPQSALLGLGACVLSPTPTTAGGKTLLIAYAGDANFVASMANGNYTVYPAAPTNLYASTITSTAINLVWTPSTETDVTGYNVYRSLSPSGPFGSPIATGVAGPSFSDPGPVVTSTIYYYEVTTVVGPLESTASNISRVPFGFAYEQLQSTVAPGERCCVAMADPGNTTILFGGTQNLNNAGTYTYMNDTWKLQGGQWTQLSPPTGAPPARSGAAMVFFPPTGQMVLFGGMIGNTMDYSDTWTFDESTSTWAQINPVVSGLSGGPLVGRRFDSQGMAYDPNTQTIVMFGGINFDSTTFFNDTWVLSLNQGTWTWTQMTPNSPTASPSQRRSVLATDPLGNVMLFGGTGPMGNLGDTWLWNGTAWNQQSPVASPGPRDMPNMDLDPDLGVVILFGGTSGPGANLSDTWSWDGANWTQVIPAAAPPGRFAFGMDYDNTAHAFEIFGGYSYAALNDTWALGLAPQPPTSLEAAAPAPGTGQVMLTWAASPTPKVSYNVKRGTISGGPYATIASLGAVTTFTDTGLTPGTYYYVVTAATGPGGVESANSTEASASVVPPAPPTSLMATANTTSPCSVTLTWTASTSTVTGYNVYQELPQATTFTEIAGLNSTFLTFTDTSNSTCAAGTFTYQVTAVGPTGIQSVPSNPATATF